MAARTRCAFRYTSEFLRAAKSKRCQGLPRGVRRYLFYLGISRFCTSDHVTHSKPIPARISYRRTIDLNDSYDSNVHRSQVLRKTNPSDRCISGGRNRFLSAIPRAPRHAFRTPRSLMFGLLNVRSLHYKVDDVLDLQRDLPLCVLLLTETWHDSESVCLSRLRTEGLIVLDQPRLRHRFDTTATNHGGVAVISNPGVHQHRLLAHFLPTTFEFVCTRLSSGASTVIVVLIYRTGPILAPYFLMNFRISLMISLRTHALCL